MRFFLLGLFWGDSVPHRVLANSWVLKWKRDCHIAKQTLNGKKKKKKENGIFNGVEKTSGDFFFPWLWLVKKWDMVKTCLQVFLEGHPCSVWSLWSTAECVEGKEQAVKGRAQEPPALMCSVGWAEDGGQIPVLICKELCTCVVHGSVYCGMGGSSFHLIHLAETEHKLSCLGSSCYRPDFFFFPGHENVLRQHRKTISHPAHPMRWKQLLSGSCCLLILALSEIITIGQKLTCFSDCSFSSLLALWDFLLIDKKPAASPVSVQRNCNCLNWANLS